MFSTRRVSQEGRVKRTLLWQRGFTLIELVAVMAIMAILVALVAPAVTGTRDASIKARAGADAKQVLTSASNYYGKQNEAETTTPHTTAVGAIGVPASGTGSVQQFVSNRWPEKFITNSAATNTSVGRIGSNYATEFEPVSTALDVRKVTLVDATAQEFLAMTAIDLQGLVDGGYLEKLPEGADMTTDFTVATGTGDPSASVKIHNFLWLFEKFSSGGPVADDIRHVAVFQLDATEIIESPEPAQGSFALELTYKRILGTAAPTPTPTATPTPTPAVDTTAPTLVSFSRTPATIDTSASDQSITVTVRATDDLSGANLVDIRYVSPSGQKSTGYNVWAPGNSPLLDWTTSFGVTFPQFSEEGTWKVQNLTLRDKTNNNRYYSKADLDALGFASDVTVISVADTTAPTLVSFSRTPATIDTSASDQSITVTVRATDDLSGANLVDVRYVSPSGQKSTGYNVWAPGNSPLLDWTTSFGVTFPQFSETGTWKVQNLTLRDKTNNDRYYTKADLDALGFASDVIVGPTPTPTPAVLMPYVAQTFLLSTAWNVWPRGIAVNESTGKVYAAWDNRILVLNGQTGQVLREHAISLWGTPRPFVVNHATNDVYVATSSGIYRISGADDTMSYVTWVGGGRQVLAVDEVTNRLYFDDYGTALVEFDVATGNRVTYPTQYITSLALNQVTRKVYAFHTSGTPDSNTVTVLDTKTGSLSSIHIGGNTWTTRMAINEATNRVYVASQGDEGKVWVFDGNTDTLLATLSVASPGDMAVDEVGNKVYVANYSGGPTTPPGLHVIDGANHTVSSLDIGGYPQALAFNRGHGKLYVTYSGSGMITNGSNGVAVVDAATGSVFQLPLAEWVQDLAIGEASNRVYVLARDRVYVIDLALGPRPVFQTPTIANGTVYKNGDTVALAAHLDAPGYQLATDFSPVDSNYLQGSEMVVDHGNGTYTVTYTLSASNVRPPGVYPLAVVVTNTTGRHAANPDLGHTFVRLDQDALVFSGPVLASSYPVVRLTNNNTQESNPQISGGQVAWGGPGGAMLYDGTVVKQLGTSGDVWDVDIDNGKVVWVQNQDWDGHNYTIYLYDGVETKAIGSGSSPRIDAGKVVWYTFDTGDWQQKIVLYDGSTTTVLGPGTEPQIHNGQVVWRNWGGSEPGIYFYDGTQTFRLTTVAPMGNFHIHSGQVIWNSGEYWNDPNSEIFLYDHASRQTVQLTSNDFAEHVPWRDQGMHLGKAVWTGDVLNRQESSWWAMGDSEVFLYDGAKVLQLTNNGYWDEEPEIDHGQVVWSGFDGHDMEIFFYDGSRILQITNNNDEDWGSSLSNGIIVWTSYDMMPSYLGGEIYLVDTRLP